MKKKGGENKSKKIKSAKNGSALILTMFILTGMLLVAMSSSYIILVGIRAAGIQTQSTKAYFTAESGAEDLLWETRHNGYAVTSLTSSETVLFGGNMPLSNANYKVYFSRFYPLVFTSIGEFQTTKRSVEIEFRN